MGLRIILALLISFSALADIKGSSSSEVIENAKKATVQIFYELLSLDKGDPLKFNEGSGFFISDDGVIVTNTHVIQKAIDPGTKSKIIIKTSTGEYLKDVKVIKCFDRKEIDLCYLKVAYQPKSYFNIDSEFKIGKGNEVYALGHSKDKPFQVKSGKIENQVGNLSIHYSTQLKHSGVILEAGFPISRGDSGGPIFYIDGVSRKSAKLIGVVHSGSATSTYNYEKQKWEKKMKYKVGIGADNIPPYLKRAKTNKKIDISQKMFGKERRSIRPKTQKHPSDMGMFYENL